MAYLQYAEFSKSVVY